MIDDATELELREWERLPEATIAELERALDERPTCAECFWTIEPDGSCACG